MSNQYRLVNSNIVEEKTENFVYSGKDQNGILKKLNSGTGFSGWTPSFFCSKLNEIS